MISDASAIEQDQVLEADLLIIGAGPAGITIARQFAGTSIRVIVLESGGKESDPTVQSLAGGLATGIPTFPLIASRLRFLGGTSNHWAGWCRPFEREDFEPRQDWPESGWPISRDDLDDYYAKATEVCQLTSKTFDDLDYWKSQPGGGQLSTLNLDKKRLLTSIFQISPPTRFGTVYRDELEKSANVNVLLNATAMEILRSDDSSINASMKKASGVRVSTLDKKTFTIKSRVTVSAVGGAETSRLLLLSDQLNPAGAGNENDLVGRYFMDHPWLASIGYLRFHQSGQNWPLYFDETRVASGRVFGVLTPSPALKKSARIGGFRLLLQPSTVSTAGVDSAREIIGELKQGNLADDLGDHIGNMYDDIDQLADVAYKSLFEVSESPFKQEPRPEDPYLGARINLSFEQRPNPNSRLTLDSSIDALGQRRIKLDWQLHETDWRTAKIAMETAAQEFGRMDIGRLRVPLEGDEANWPPLMSGGFHHMGGARMASDPQKGVVNADCQVHSIENLYVAGSAVFPTCGFANPTLTIVALSLKLADKLRSVLS